MRIEGSAPSDAADLKLGGERVEVDDPDHLRAVMASRDPEDAELL